MRTLHQGDECGVAGLSHTARASTLPVPYLQGALTAHQLYQLRLQLQLQLRLQVIASCSVCMPPSAAACSKRKALSCTHVC